MGAGASCGRAEHGSEKSTCPAPNRVSSRGRGCRGLGPNGQPSWLRPLGRSGSEEGKQPSPEAVLWGKAHCSNDFLRKSGEGVGDSYRSLKGVLAAWALGPEGNQIRTMEIHPCNKFPCNRYLLSSYNVLAPGKALGCGSG